jgi:hypothetical protein
MVPDRPPYMLHRPHGNSPFVDRERPGVAPGDHPTGGEPGGQPYLYQGLQMGRVQP